MKNSHALIFLFLLSVGQLCANEFTLTFSKANASCNGSTDGQAEVTVVSNANPPYTYSWSNGQTTPQITGLVSGTYSVTVTDSQQNDTTVAITIEEKTCEIAAELVFTPNGDGINDEWNIDNIG